MLPNLRIALPLCTTFCKVQEGRPLPQEAYNLKFDMRKARQGRGWEMEMESAVKMLKGYACILANAPFTWLQERDAD